MAKSPPGCQKTHFYVLLGTIGEDFWSHLEGFRLKFEYPFLSYALDVPGLFVLVFITYSLGIP